MKKKHEALAQALHASEESRAVLVERVLLLEEILSECTDERGALLRKCQASSRGPFSERGKPVPEEVLVVGVHGVIRCEAWDYYDYYHPHYRRYS